MTNGVAPLPSLKAFRSTLLSAFLLGACAHTDPVETRYDNEFDPPRTWLSMHIGVMRDNEISPRLITSGREFVRRIDDDSEFVVAVRNESCESICYFFMPRISDHIYWVLTTDESQERFNKYFSYSLPEHGNP